MTISMDGIEISNADVENIYRIVLANNAKEELIQNNYFIEYIPENDSEHLKKLCSFDYTVMPDKKSSAYIEWKIALIELSDLCLYIFNVHHHMCIMDYSMKYTEKYTLSERIIAWSKDRNEKMTKIGNVFGITSN